MATPAPSGDDSPPPSVSTPPSNPPPEETPPPDPVDDTPPPSPPPPEETPPPPEETPPPVETPPPETPPPVETPPPATPPPVETPPPATPPPVETPPPATPPPVETPPPATPPPVETPPPTTPPPVEIPPPTTPPPVETPPPTTPPPVETPPPTTPPPVETPPPALVPETPPPTLTTSPPAPVPETPPSTPSPSPPAPDPQTPSSPSPGPPSQPPITVPSSTSPPSPTLTPPSLQPTPETPLLSPPIESHSPPSSILDPPMTPPSSLETLPPPSPSRSSTGLIVGVVIGGVAVLAVFGLLWFLFARKKKRKDQYGAEGYYLPKDGFYQGSVQSGIRSNPQSTEHYSMPTNPSISPNGAVPLRSNSSTPAQPLSTNGSGGLWSNSSGADNSTPPSSYGIMVGGSSSSFSFEELSVATDGFSNNNLLGQGGFGYVHKGILPNGKIVAVKSLKADSGQGDREFHAEVETISRVHHKHLVSLVGYCITGPQKLLVYEFLPNKTMEFHLHGNKQTVMDWPTRLRIAIGAAKGLAYLHEDCHPKIIHRDIKAANILLDFNFEAQVADFGLAKFTSDANTHVSTRVMGTFGYLAPEYANSGKLTEKSDVFSFGVMLLEFITGRRPVDYSLESQMEDSLVDWARPLLSRAVQDGNFDALVDARLENKYEYEEMGRMVTCAASCVRHSAKRRPRMSQVVRALEGNLSLSDLNDGVKPGFTSFHSSSDLDSGADKEEIQKFRKLVYLSEDYGTSDMSRTRSELSDGLSSSEMRRQT